MSWSEVKEGVWERPIGEHEMFIELTGESGLPLGREHWAITTQATFAVDCDSADALHDFVEILREAWKQFRFAQPNIATRADNGKVTYEIPNPVTIRDWVNDTFYIAAPGVSSSELIATRKPSLYMVLHYVPHESRILLQTSHWRTDGIGVLYVLDAYFELVCQVAAGTLPSLTWGSEVARLSHSVEEICALPLVASPELEAIAKGALSTFSLIPRNIGIKYQGDSTTPPQGTRLKHLTFTDAESKAIFVACRGHNISLTSAVHASVAQANHAFALEMHKDRPYTSTIRFGLRPYVPKAYSGSEYGATLMTSGYMFQVSSPRVDAEQWFANANAFNAEYKKGYTNIMPAHREYARTLCDVVRNMPPPDPTDLPCDMDISSLGIVDGRINAIHRAKNHGNESKMELVVTSIAISTEILTRQLVCFVWTFRDILNLQITYNEAYHIDQEVAEILKYIKAVTLERLGIDTDSLMASYASHQHQ